MERAICEQCGHPQPTDWRAGDLCVECGAPVRREVRCAWCAEWTPFVKFCRACGCEVLSPDQYGLARMLKSAGVDQFSLAKRLHELDPEQASNLGRIYNAQLAVVARRVDEVRLCEYHLLQKTFSQRLSDQLVPRLPLDKEGLAALAAGPAGPFEKRPEALLEIARQSPIAGTRTLAWIALFRMGRFKGACDSVCQALQSDDAEVALEAALAFASWRARLSPQGLWRTFDQYSWATGFRGIDRRRLAEVAGSVPPGSPLRSWAAAALTLAWSDEYGLVPEPESAGRGQPPDWLRAELHAGLTSRDPDLRFTCAMALGEDGIVAGALAARDDGLRLVARTWLAKHRSPAIAPLLIQGPDDVRAEILENLWPPLPDVLVEPVLTALGRANEPTRASGVRLLLPSLTEEIVERLIHLARRTNDAKVFKLLLEAERLPGAHNVVRAIVAADLLEPLSDALLSHPERVDFTDEPVRRFAGKPDAQVLERLIAIADRQLDALDPDERAGGPGRGAGVASFLARVAFGSAPAEVRSDAWRTLEQHDRRRWDWLSPSGLGELFGTAPAFLDAAAAVLSDAELGSMCYSLAAKLSERWAEVAETFREDRKALERFAAALRERASRELDIEAVRLLSQIAVSCPGAALPQVAALLRDPDTRWLYRTEAIACLLREFDSLTRQVGHDQPLAAELADALAEMLAASGDALQQHHVPAIELLAKLARKYAGLGEGLRVRLGSVLKNRDFVDRDLRRRWTNWPAPSGSRRNRRSGPRRTRIGKRRLSPWITWSCCPTCR